MRVIKTIAAVSIVLVSSVAAFAQASEETSKREVKIFLQRTHVAADGSTDDSSAPVKRMVDAKGPLSGSLAELFSEKISADEEKAGFWSPTYGMKFEGVTLKNGIATVRFSQPPDKTNYGSSGPMIFGEAITKTASQFASVKRVRICAVGDTMIDSELERPFPRCAAK